MTLGLDDIGLYSQFYDSLKDEVKDKIARDYLETLIDIIKKSILVDNYL